MRKPILAGNWKMNKTVAEATELVKAMKGELLKVETVDRVLCPPFMAVPAVAGLLSGAPIGVGAQDMYYKDLGAYTGEVSALMVKEFCQYVIIGHSERRQLFGETDESVNAKIKAALAHGLRPIVCVGESLELRQQDKTESWVSGQVKAALAGLSSQQVAGLVVAYEPIWAIGTGMPATADEAERVCGQVVRATITELYDIPTGDAVRVQYGGSVTAANAAELMSKPNIDGGLVGGASLKPAEFVAIVQHTAKSKGLSK